MQKLSMVCKTAGSKKPEARVGQEAGIENRQKDCDHLRN